MACKENQVEENVSSMLQRQIEEYRIDMVFFTVKEAKTIVNFISRDYENRRIRNKRVWRVADVRNGAYLDLIKLLEMMDQHTPLSIADKEDDLHMFSCLVEQVKGSFKGAWLDELVGFSHENQKNFRHSVNDLKDIKQYQKYYSERLRNELKIYTESSQETRDQLQQIKAQIADAKKASRKRRRDDGDGGDDDDRLEELERSEQTLSKDLEELGWFKDTAEIRLKEVEALLQEVCKQLNQLAPNFRAKLAALEFDIFSPTIIRNNLQDPNLTGLRKKNGDAGLVKMIPTKPPGEEGSY